MLFSYEGSIALKEIGGILDECLARRHRLRLSGFRILELLCNLRHFAVEARLIPFRRLAFNARIVVDKGQVGIFELLQANPARWCGDPFFRNVCTVLQSFAWSRSCDSCSRGCRG